MRYYREALFVPRPGPDTSTCKEIAARHQGTLTPTVPTLEAPGVDVAGADVTDGAAVDESAATTN
jgi:hypothetical protein